MAIQMQGNGGVVADVDGTTFRALRVTPRPVDYGSLGLYSYGGMTGILPAALGADSEIFQFRWTDATRLAMISKVRFAAAVSTTFFAAGVPVQIDMIKSTGWSAAGTGGTAITPAALLKRRTSMGSTLVAAGDIRIATTTALGTGTKTMEGYALANACAAGPITASLYGPIFHPFNLFEAEPGDGGCPLILAANEGFSIRSVAVPATGTWSASITVDWAEVASY